MKKKIFITTIILLLIVTTSIVFISKNKSVNATLDTVSLKEVEKDNMFAVMFQNDNGEYTEQSTFPGENYKLNEEKSGCIDNNGEKIENSLTYDSDGNKVTVSTNKTSYCYLYFDIKGMTTKELIESRKSNDSLSNEPVGGMYRYQGTYDAVQNNYICLKKIGQAGCSETNDSNMYRIIGITPEGNIKVIKQISYGKYAWNTKYDLNDSGSIYECDANGCSEWPDSEIYQTLNTDFYNTLNSC